MNEIRKKDSLPRTTKENGRKRLQEKKSREQVIMKEVGRLAIMSRRKKSH